MVIVQRETKPALPVSKHGESAGKKIGVRARKTVKPVDDWKFLDEIEAPMWIDFSIKATFAYNDCDEDWFQISHPFHQSSSSQLISALSHTGEVCTDKEFGPNVFSSPKLPASVTRSRGKNSRQGELPPKMGKLAPRKHEPVKNLSTSFSLVKSVCDQKVKSQSRNNSMKGKVMGKSSLVNPGSGCDQITKSQSSSNNRKGNSLVPSVELSTSVEESKTSLSFGTLTEVKSRPGSTISSGSTESQNRTFGGTSALLSSLKVTLRRSCVTRKALRMEVVQGRHSEGNQSSSGKSSVGSSSNPGYDVKSTNILKSQSKVSTPESRNVKAIPQSTKEKVKVLGISKKSAAGSQLVPSKSRLGGKTADIKLDHRGSIKSKVNVAVHSRATKVLSSNECATAAARVGGRKGISRCHAPREGKENQIVKTIGGNNTNNRARSLIQGPKVTEPRNAVSQLTCPKGKKSSSSSRAEGRNLINPTTKVHFR